MKFDNFYLILLKNKDMPKEIKKDIITYRGIPRTDFLTPDFSALVEQKGVDVVWERAIPCPCSKRQVHKSTCRNCRGTGWVFINPTLIKAIVSSINRDTKYKEWSTELLGTVSVTVRPEHCLNYMDKFTILNSSAVQSEVLEVKFSNDKLYINTIYPVLSIVEIFKYEDSNQPLKLIQQGYSVDENHFITFVAGKELKEGDFITITYKHNVVYNILDFPHDVRNTYILNTLSREEVLKLPISAVARRAHNVIDSLDFDGDNVFDNSYHIG